MPFGVKRMGELDRKAFHDACKEIIAKDDFDVEFALIYSKWEHEIRQPEWYTDAEGKKKVNLCLVVMLDIICCSRAFSSSRVKFTRYGWILGPFFLHQIDTDFNLVPCTVTPTCYLF